MLIDSDRELMELAAKAAGINGEWVLDTNFIQKRWYFNIPYDNQGMITGFEWNPLTDDGDALRLAVKLRLTVSWDRDEDFDYATATPPNTFQNYIYIIDKDPYYATRRAIVRAAAEIGKAMENKC